MKFLTRIPPVSRCAAMVVYRQVWQTRRWWQFIALVDSGGWHWGVNLWWEPGQLAWFDVAIGRRWYAVTRGHWRGVPVAGPSWWRCDDCGAQWNTVQEWCPVCPRPTEHCGGKLRLYVKIWGRLVATLTLRRGFLIGVNVIQDICGGCPSLSLALGPAEVDLLWRGRPRVAAQVDLATGGFTAEDR